jgi:hypothetical protein
VRQTSWEHDTFAAVLEKTQHKEYISSVPSREQRKGKRRKLLLNISRTSCEIVALRENFVERPESYSSFSAKSCIFLAHGLGYISPFPYTT